MTDREKLIELLMQTSKELQERGGVTWYDFADHLLANGVTVQRHGRWEKAKYIEAPVYVCSECGNREPLPRKFCPECGLMMEAC